MEISLRLKHIAGLVNYRSLADIGTDHALLPIFLCANGRVDYAIACDINKGPLDSARANIAANGLADKITLRLGSGIERLQPNEVEACVIAGMGGMNVISILTERIAVAKSFKQLILQPQRNLPQVRRFLHNNGFSIADEYILVDADKFYNIMDCRPTTEAPYNEAGYLLGERLIAKQDKILNLYLQQEIERISDILQTKLPGERRQELLHEHSLYKELIDRKGIHNETK